MPATFVWTNGNCGSCRTAWGNGLMSVIGWGKHVGPALLLGVLALFFSSAPVNSQSLKDLPPPPPAPTPKPTPKPTPTPEPKDEDYEVVRISSNLVMVPVSVVNAAGEPVHDLQVSDFHLEEQGRQQDITEIGNPEQVPLDIAILFDISTSVSKKSFFELQQAAAAAFLKQVLKSGDRAAVFTIADEPKLVHPLTSAEAAASTIVAIPAATGPVPTAFYDTVSAAAKYLIADSAERHRRVILVISDGDDNYSSAVGDASIEEYRAANDEKVDPAATRAKLRNKLRERRNRAVLDVQKSVQQADATFYSINPGGPSVRLNQISTSAQNAMQSIAESTGGYAFVPAAERDLERVFSEIAAELRGQYLLLYYSNLQSPAGQFRTIKVSIPTHSDYRVRARQGYYPKQQQ
jgi:Ca-activated chloride channel family protein